MPRPKRQDRRSEIRTLGDQDEMNLSKYVTTKQAAVMLGVGQEHIRKLLSASKVKGIKLGHDWLVFAPSMEKYVETKSNRGRPRSRLPQMQVKSNGQS